MAQLCGELNLPQSPAQIWDRLIDPAFLATCMPQLESVEADDSAFLVCRVRPTLAFLKGTIRVTLSLYDRQPPASLRIRVDSKGIGSTATVETTVCLTALDTGTRLVWTADIIELGGLLKPIGRSLIDAAASKVIAEGWVSFQQKL
ncbi:MAG: SRPBCC domain-containing protein [Candidatus Latescibacteria bacterium]|jgi:hypothetical protein|nr:hypothetical protein [Gemmatimonadaceae bacterium]MDP6018335.1 SRPBCC domain-containing protein [Candidatus Latescibacterota bacterium]MDP7447380.1 SRPBCC domain-containing protein [Candidatus Latescibacterota bacterium]HJP31566.1 SRPBCC domain-containing protein [Candidatus Latescibacterota bacterium]